MVVENVWNKTLTTNISASKLRKLLQFILLTEQSFAILFLRYVIQNSRILCALGVFISLLFEQHLHMCYFISRSWKCSCCCYWWVAVCIVFYKSWCIWSIEVIVLCLFIWVQEWICMRLLSWFLSAWWLTLSLVVWRQRLHHLTCTLLSFMSHSTCLFLR